MLTLWAEQHRVQSFKLQFLSMTAVQDLQHGQRQGGVLHSQPNSERTHCTVIKAILKIQMQVQYSNRLYEWAGFD